MGSPNGVIYEINQFMVQLRVLLWKNYKLFTRQYITTLILILAPLFACLYLVSTQQLADSLAKDENIINPRIRQIEKLPKCWGHECVTLRFWLTGELNAWSNSVINDISQKNGLKIGKDVKISTGSPNSSDFFTQNMNKTQFGVVLCTEDYKLPKNNYIEYIPCSQNNGHSIYIYTILYNMTQVSFNVFDKSAPDPLDSNVIALKYYVDKAIIQYHSSLLNLQSPTIELLLQSFPQTTNRAYDGFDVVSMIGPMIFFIPPMLIFGLFISEIVKEKELRLRHGLSIVGVSSTAFWFSWFVTGFIISFTATVVLVSSACYFEFEMFKNSPYWLQILNFQLFTTSMIMLGFCLTTLLKTAKVSYTISYSFLLIGIVLQSILESHLMMKLIHVKALPNWTDWVRWGFSFYPGYNFSKIYNDISSKAGGHPNFEEFKFDVGEEYLWKDFRSPRTGYINGYEYYISSSMESVWDQVWDFFLFMILTWFFDHVLESNRGKADSVWFVFTKDYWGLKQTPRLRKNNNIEMVAVKNQLFDDDFTSGILEEKDGLRIENLTKTYKKSCVGRSENIYAVKNISLNVEKDELLALIGHNGAGKTTLLSMLTGLLSPTSGNAYISNYDIHHDMSKIYNLIGYCPQFDILWDQLTGYEHLWLFSVIKNIEKTKRDSNILKKLSDVGLLDSKDQLVGKYSGGMRRRLSVAICDIGNPSIIFMDEPTTGMDPISRRFVWKLIQTMKKNKVVILTTHSMEEAEVLADSIAVMVDGRIKCIGSALYLKNTYGEGYKIELFSKNSTELWNYIQLHIGKVSLLDNSGGSLVVSIPRSDASEALKLYKLIESDPHMQELIENWGISNASLEEVFMRVTEKLHVYT